MFCDGAGAARSGISAARRAARASSGVASGFTLGANIAT
jgi:hypothetical protein